MIMSTRIHTTLRINLTGPAPAGETDGERLRSAVEMAVFAERHGFSIVNVEEHHCAEVGWLSSPLVLAGVIAGRTERIRIRACALLIPLYDPLRLAEEIAILDLASNGRVLVVAGQGYRPIEYHAMDKDWDSRGADTDLILDTLLKAWSGEPFEYRGRTVRIGPVPQTKPHPPLWYGGMSKAAAKRAARFGLPFYPPAEMPDLIKTYNEELAKLGKSGSVDWPREGTSLIFIDEDPDRAWQEIGPCLLAEAAEYGSWAREGVERPFASSDLTLERLREERRYEILTPGECRDRIRNGGPEYSVILHPMAGGVPLDRAWNCLRLYANQVLAPLSEDGI